MREREREDEAEDEEKEEQKLTSPKKTFLKKTQKTGNHEYEQGGGIALEAQDFTDFLHHPGFPSCVLEPGQAMTRIFELRWGSVEKSKEEKASCAAKKKVTAVPAAASDKSAVGAEEMMM